MGKFKKGMSRLDGAGRKAGTPNKVNSDVKEAMTDLISLNVSKLQNWLDKVAEDSPAKAFDLLIKMMEFVLPKQSRVEYQDPQREEQVSKIVVEFVESKTTEELEEMLRKAS